MQQGSRKSNGDGRRSRWSAHREQRRAVLVEAAVEAVLRYGPEVDMAQVAAVAGVSKPVLYRYFADKAELWLAVGEHVAQLVVAEIVPVVARVRAERELVSATIDAYLTAIGANPDLYRFLVHQSGLPGMAHLVANAARTVATELARAVGDRLRALGLDAGPAEPWAYGMVGMVQSVGDWWIRHDRPISRAALTEYLTTLLWHGLEGVRASADLSPLHIQGDARERA
ncbi:TetR family transcriptional regulator [Virgisporangium aurantiacum]|uniref:TetR family transcriptional regulator n=1 Tax=Virgisporangium aurantiacum TaxID=175570 RepID=UPI00195215E7|nr:TetR family transcriptional regulator [Virgisporangium aurantiacum]